jgi:hypothetical protein
MDHQDIVDGELPQWLHQAEKLQRQSLEDSLLAALGRHIQTEHRPPMVLYQTHGQTIR